MRIFPENEIPLGEVARVVLAAGGREPAKDVDKRQLAIGIAVELEHTDDPHEAERITRQHLAENPEYYTSPMKKDWGADEAKERIEDMVKNAVSIGKVGFDIDAEFVKEDLLDATFQAILKGLYERTIGAVFDRWHKAAKQEGREKDVLDKIDALAWSKWEEYVSGAIEFLREVSSAGGGYSRRHVLDIIADDSKQNAVAIRRKVRQLAEAAGFNLDAYASTVGQNKIAQVDISISKGWLYQCKRCGKQHLGVLVQPQQCGIEGCESPDFDKLPYESKTAASDLDRVFVVDGINHVKCPSCQNTTTMLLSPDSGEGPWGKRCRYCGEDMLVMKDKKPDIGRVAGGTDGLRYDGRERSIKDGLRHIASTKEDCPLCGGARVGSCRCSGPHTVEDLKKGHGLHCANGHSWSWKGEAVYDPQTKMAMTLLSDQPSSPTPKDIEAKTAKASVFVLEDDPKRIEIFKSAFGDENVVVTRNIHEALDLLRTRKFARVFLDRDLSHPKETGEDVAWQMEQERLCPDTPVVIHSENMRGQKVMARYLGRYHRRLSVVPFKELRKSLEIPGGVRL